MTDGALDGSVTLEEVFAALATKRVPMAPSSRAIWSSKSPSEWTPAPAISTRAASS